MRRLPYPRRVRRNPVWERQIKEVGRRGAGGGCGREALGLDAHHVVGTGVVGEGGGVEVFGRRSSTTPTWCPSASCPGVGGGDRGAEGRDGVADRGAGRGQPVVGRGAGAGLRRPAGVGLVDDDHRLDLQRPDRVGHRGGRPGHPPAGARTDSSRVDRGGSVRMAGGQTARGVACSWRALAARWAVGSLSGCCR